MSRAALQDPGHHARLPVATRSGSHHELAIRAMRTIAGAGIVSGGEPRIRGRWLADAERRVRPNNPIEHPGARHGWCDLQRQRWPSRDMTRRMPGVPRYRPKCRTIHTRYPSRRMSPSKLRQAGTSIESLATSGPAALNHKTMPCLAVWLEQTVSESSSESPPPAEDRFIVRTAAKE